MGRPLFSEAYSTPVSPEVKQAPPLLRVHTSGPEIVHARYPRWEEYHRVDSATDNFFSNAVYESFVTTDDAVSQQRASRGDIADLAAEDDSSDSEESPSGIASPSMLETPLTDSPISTSGPQWNVMPLSNSSSASSSASSSRRSSESSSPAQLSEIRTFSAAFTPRRPAQVTRTLSDATHVARPPAVSSPPTRSRTLPVTTSPSTTSLLVSPRLGPATTPRLYTWSRPATGMLPTSPIASEPLIRTNIRRSYSLISPTQVRV